MLRFEFWLNDGQNLPTAVKRREMNFLEARRDAKQMLAEQPDLRKIDLICGARHVGAVGPVWASCSCTDLNLCGDHCPKYRTRHVAHSP